jgi:hypothetical protein
MCSSVSDLTLAGIDDTYFGFFICGDVRRGETMRLPEARELNFLAKGDVLAVEDLVEFFFLIDRGST